MERFKIIGNKLLGLNGFFSVRTIAKETGIDPKEVRIVLDRMLREGLVERYELRKISNQLRGRPGAVLVYQVKKKDNLEKRIIPKLKTDTAMDRMWKVIRYRRNFTRRDLRIDAEAGFETAKWFTKMLARAGYVKQIARREWALVKDPGPKRPYVNDQKKHSRGVSQYARTAECSRQ